ncbi:MAG TPA: alanine racemase [Pyrinomonadaceae bacterium]|jgi:alanine racemase
MINATRPTWAEIHLDHLAFNLQSVKKRIGENVKYMAVVKADAYGHGALPCARTLERAGIDWFGVALPEEGIELRKNGIRKHILCLGSFWSGQENELLEYHLTPTIFRLEIAEKFDRAAKERGVVADVHVKVDTGMNRIGVRFDAVREFAEELKRFTNLKVDGVMTHFAAADNDERFTNLQISRFNETVEIFHEKGFRPTYKDLANSPGAIGYENAKGNMVRLGGILYGLWWDVLPKTVNPPDLKPVLTLHTKISLLKRVPEGETVGYNRTWTAAKDSLLATIPIGYQDGYMRGFSNCSRAIAGGEYARVAGRVSMDWTLIDVSEVPNVKVGDEVILIGEQNGLKITAEELAAHCGTNSYEVTCGISRRVTRIYKSETE